MILTSDFKKEDYQVGEKLEVLAITVRDDEKTQIRPLALIENNSISRRYIKTCNLNLPPTYAQKASGEIGIWKISFEENKNDYTKVFINTSPKLGDFLYLIIDTKKTKDILIEDLKSVGVKKDYFINNSKVFFLFNDSNNDSNAILLSRDDFESKDDNYYVLKRLSHEWRGYNLTSDDIVRFAGQHINRGEKLNLILYKNLYFTPSNNFITDFKSKDELIICKVIDFLKESYKGERGNLKKYQEEFFDFLDQVEIRNSQFELLKSQYHLTKDDISKIIAFFQDELISYTDGYDFDANFIKQIIKKNEKLRSHFIIEAQEEVKKQIQPLKDKLQDLNNQIKNKEELLEHKEAVLKSLEDKYKKITTATEKIESESEKFILTVKNKIKNAVPSEILELFSVPKKYPETEPKFSDGFTASVASSSDLFTLNEANDLVGEGRYQLTLLGVSEDFAGALLSVLLSCYLNGQNFILAGPRSDEIADALSLFVQGKHVSSYKFPQNFSSESFETLKNTDEKIILLKNALTPDWISNLPELSNNVQNKLFIVSHPFVEDLVLYPQTFYKYFLPIFTEPVIDKDISTEDTPAPYIISEDLIIKLRSQHKKMERGVNKYHFLSLTSFQKNIYEKLLRTVNCITDKQKDIDIVKYIIFEMPLLFVTGNENILRENLNNKVADIDIRTIISNFIGSNDED